MIHQDFAKQVCFTDIPIPVCYYYLYTAIILEVIALAGIRGEK